MKRGWRILLFGMGGLLPPALAAAQTPPPPGPTLAETSGDRLNTTGRDIPLGGPLTDNGFVLGEVSYTLTAQDQIVIDAQSLLPLLQRALTPEAWQGVATAIGTRPSISANDLFALGIPISYDPATFGLKLAINPDLRPRQAISISGGYGDLTGPVAEPEDFSAYITAFGNVDYVHRGDDSGLRTPSVVLDSAVRYRGFVLENEATVQDGFQREGTRIVYDDLARTARYSAGDLQPISRGFSGATPMAGLSVVRVYADLEPQRNIQPRGQRSFTLVRPSTVETFINGQSVQQTRLNPGTYDIRDFPFAQGANDVRLVIRDDAGIESTVSFSINFDRTLLAPGLTEFGLYAGVKAPFDGGGRSYTGAPVASGFFRRGLSETLTAGANFQASERGGVLGGEGVWASRIGTLGIDLAASSIDRIGQGYAVNIGYERIFGGAGGGVKSLVGSFQATSRNFATPDALFAANPFAYEFGATYSQSIGLDHYIALNSFYSIGRDEVENQLSARASYTWRTNSRLLLTAEAIYEDRRQSRDYGIRVALTYRFNRSSSATAEVDTSRDRARLSYQTSSGRGVGSYSASASIDRSEQVSGINGTLNAILNRAEVGAAHLTSLSRSGNAIVDQRTSIRAATSIAFAGGSFGLARPIYDSFAMVKPHSSLKAPVYLSPTNDEYLARSGTFGPAVASELSAYSPTLLTYDAPGAPIGYDLGSGTVQFRPPYRSGYLVEVGSDYSATYTGRILQADGQPLSLEAGFASELSNPDRPPVQMFTNRGGRFAVSGLRPGKWRIEIGKGDKSAVYMLDVPADADGLIRGGDLKPEVKK
jgi:outer membrane usher protein